jgi:hypothetical protein
MLLSTFSLQTAKGTQSMLPDLVQVVPTSATNIRHRKRPAPIRSHFHGTRALAAPHEEALQLQQKRALGWTNCTCGRRRNEPLPMGLHCGLMRQTHLQLNRTFRRQGRAPAPPPLPMTVLTGCGSVQRAHTLQRFYLRASISACCASISACSCSVGPCLAQGMAQRRSWRHAFRVTANNSTKQLAAHPTDLANNTQATRKQANKQHTQNSLTRQTTPPLKSKPTAHKTSPRQVLGVNRAAARFVQQPKCRWWPDAAHCGRCDAGEVGISAQIAPWL